VRGDAAGRSKELAGRTVEVLGADGYRRIGSKAGNIQALFSIAVEEIICAEEGYGEENPIAGGPAENGGHRRCKRGLRPADGISTRIMN